MITDEENQNLIGLCKIEIRRWTHAAEAVPDKRYMVELMEIALATLTAGNSPVIPDGWVMVPREPTEDMVIRGFESEPNEVLSDAEEWKKFEAMSGCQQAAHRAKLCWQSMLAAAPEHE